MAKSKRTVRQKKIPRFAKIKSFPTTHCRQTKNRFSGTGKWIEKPLKVTVDTVL